MWLLKQCFMLDYILQLDCKTSLDTGCLELLVPFYSLFLFPQYAFLIHQIDTFYFRKYTKSCFISPPPPPPFLLSLNYSKSTFNPECSSVTHLPKIHKFFSKFYIARKVNYCTNRKWNALCLSNIIVQLNKCNVSG